MNKIHTINLGGHPFTVDEDAFEYLQAYIRSLRKHFKNSDPTGGQRGHLYHGIPGRIRS